MRRALWKLKRGMWWFQRAPLRGEIDTRVYTGLPGSGKTLCLVRDAIRLMRYGYRVAANFYIRDPETGLTAEPCASWLDCMRLTVEAMESDEVIVFVIDELQTVADSRSWQLTPPFLLWLWSQRRHCRAAFVASTQSLVALDRRFRMLVARAISVRPVFPRWTRLAWFGEAELIVQDDGQSLSLTERHFAWYWMPWYAYHGYSTRQIVVGEDLRQYKDEEMQEVIADLVRRAQVAAGIPNIEAMADEYADLWEVSEPEP